MLATLIGLLLFFWILGIVAHVGGAFIHLLLGLAILLFLFNLFTGRRVDL
jgi:hypothetical protein